GAQLAQGRVAAVREARIARRGLELGDDGEESRSAACEQARHLRLASGRAHEHLLGGGEGARTGSVGRGEHVRAQQDVSAGSRAYVRREARELRLGRVRLEALCERELDAGGRKPARDREACTGLLSQWRSRVLDGARCVEQPLEPSTHGGAHERASSKASMASEQPRGGAPGARPNSSMPPPQRRTRSRVRIATAESPLPRSTNRASPTSPSGTGASVTGSTGTTESHGGASSTSGGPARRTPGTVPS